LKALEFHAAGTRILAARHHVARGHRLDEAPLIVRAHEPTKADGGLIEQRLAPRIAHTVLGDAALEHADDREAFAIERPDRAERWHAEKFFLRKRLRAFSDCRDRR